MKKHNQWRKQMNSEELLISMSMSDDAALAWQRMLLLYRIQDGVLPDDDATVARQIGFSVRDFKKVRPQLEAQFHVADGCWRHDAEDERIAAAERDYKARAKGAEVTNARRRMKTVRVV